MTEVRKYELVIVYDPSLTDAELDAEAKLVSERLEKFDAQEIIADRWGRRDLAYMTKKRRSGIYVAYYFSCARPEVVEEMNTTLRISDNVLLFQTHRVSEKTRKFQGRTSQKPAAEAAA